jgi:flagellar biosynthesis protein FlhB
MLAAVDSRSGTPTEQPTARRLAEARRAGRVAISGALTAASSFGGALLVLAWTGGALAEALRAETAAGLRIAADAAAGAAPGTRALAARAADLLPTALALIAPLLAAAFGLAWVAGLAQTQALFSWRPLRPDAGRLSPMAGWQRLWSAATAIAALRATAAIAIVAGATWHALAAHAADVVRLAGRPPATAAWAVARIGGGLLVHAACALAALGALDHLWQRHRLRRELMMTREEVRRERREQEGDPRLRAARRRAHAEATRLGPLEARLRTAAVVVSADDGATALRYDAIWAPVPEIAAQGDRLAGHALLAAARRRGLPIVRDPALRRRLAAIDVGATIPDAAFDDVARLVAAIRG